jgi:DNA-directed RNA polymerase specialized sigma24 family protein
MACAIDISEVRALALAYQHLPAAQREALRMIVLEEGSYEEVSSSPVAPSAR